MQSCPGAAAARRPAAKPDLFTLTGYEVSTSKGGKPVHYRQSWALRPVTDAELRGRDAFQERERARMTEFMRQHIGGAVLGFETWSTSGDKAPERS